LSWFLLGTESKIIQVGAKTTPMPTPGAWAGIAGQANVSWTPSAQNNYYSLCYISDTITQTAFSLKVSELELISLLMPAGLVHYANISVHLRI
jgi:hypothetical protein